MTHKNVIALLLLSSISMISNGQTHTLSSGWNLVGNDAGTNVDPIAVFGNADAKTALSATVSTVWTWDAANLQWNFFAPSMSASALSSYAGSKGYGVLTTIKKGDGFWVNSTSAVAVDLAAKATPTPPAIDLSPLNGSSSLIWADYAVSGAGCSALGFRTGSYGESVSVSASTSGAKATINIYKTNYFTFTLDYQSGNNTSGYDFKGTFREATTGLSGTAAASSVTKPYSMIKGFFSGTVSNCTISATLS